MRLYPGDLVSRGWIQDTAALGWRHQVKFSSKDLADTGITEKSLLNISSTTILFYICIMGAKPGRRGQV